MFFLRITEASTRDSPGLDWSYSASIWRFYKVLMETCKHARCEDEPCLTRISYLTQFEVCQVEVFFSPPSSGAITASSNLST